MTGMEPRSEPLRLREALEAADDIVFLTSRDGTFTFVNPAFSRAYGWAAEEVVGCATPRILKSGLLPDSRYRQLWKQLLSRTPARIDLVNRARSGRLVHVEGSASPIVENGGIVGFVTIQQDLTARGQEDEQRRLAQFALDHGPDLVCWIRADGRIRDVNDAAARALGYTRDELLTKSIFDVDPDAPQGRFAPQPDAPTPAIIGFESSYRCKNGTRLPVDVGVTFCDLGGMPSACVIARDLSARRRLEEQLRHAQKMEAVGRLAGGIAHDFNNLLTSIMGYGELLAVQLEQQPALAADLAEIRRAGERAERLIRQLLIFSRQQPIEPRALDPCAIIGDLEKMMRRVIGEDVRLQTVRPPGSWHVRIDPGQFEQILMNLAVNARDAMPIGGALSIALSNANIGTANEHGVPPGEYVSIRVRDTGSGIGEDVLPHIFDPFFTTKPVGKGTGLGLSTVYGIIKQYGGAIHVDSRPGAGTAFTIYLPRTDEAGPPGEPAGAPPERDLRGAETILLAEDEPEIRDLMRRTLERHGYTVLAAAGPSDAIALGEYHRGRIELLLSDVVMPGLNGPALAQRILRYRPGIRVLYVSGYPFALDPAVLSPRVRFLPKPFAAETLLRHVRGCLDLRPAAD